ncbi:hypothetical protein NE865_09226 [Phthorimaea operculella]|nr:hypothetical protein NE865_09226 [Phthorimaea operculella]
MPRPHIFVSFRAIDMKFAEGKKVLLKNNVRLSKYDDLVEEVDLLEVNPLHSHVRLQSGREAVVSNRQLAPTAEPFATDGAMRESELEALEPRQTLEHEPVEQQSEPTPAAMPPPPARSQSSEPESLLRRSSRERRPPQWLQDYQRS